MRALRFCATALLATVLIACSSTPPSRPPESSPIPASRSQDSIGQPQATTPTVAPAVKQTGRPVVVSTVAPIVNIIRNVGGDRIDLVGIVPEGTDSHTFEPSPSDVRLLAQADLIVLNGLHLETPTEELALANKKPTARLLKLGDNTITRDEWIFDFSFPEEEGDPNPHLWMDVRYAMRYAELVQDALIEIDPPNRQYYQENTRRFLELLAKLDAAIAEAVKTVPEKNRKLLTYHDSWAYWARRYGFKVIGAIQPSDFSEPSPREVAEMIDQLRREQVPAIFGSEVFPSKVLEQIGRETGVRYIDTLRDDDLPGDKDAPEHTYVGMMLENMRTMITALGGSAASFQGINPANTYAR